MDSHKYERFINFVVGDITNRVKIVRGVIRWATHSFPEIHRTYIKHSVNIFPIGDDNPILKTFELGFHRDIIDRYGIDNLEVRKKIMKKVCENLKKHV